MSLQGAPPSFTNSVSLGINPSGTGIEKLNNLPTLVMSRSTAQPVNQTVSFANNIQCVNFIAGMFATLLSATLVPNTVYLFVNSGGGAVPMNLDSGGSIGGGLTYTLKSGTAVQFLFDGINLS